MAKRSSAAEAGENTIPLSRMDAVPPMNFPRESGSPVYTLPLQNEGPSPFYPPVCLKTHWDPTAILRHSLPEGHLAQPLDPRPWTRICMEYTTAGEQERAPDVPAGAVLPSGGQFYPPGRYQAAIDKESELRRLDRPLGTLEGNQWEPSLNSDMFNARILVPSRAPPSDPFRVHEMAYPKALLRSGPYDCRAADDRMATALTSDYLFNNATKQDRYKMMGKPAKPAAPSGALQAGPGKMRPDLDFSGRTVYEKGSYGQQAANTAADLRANAVDVHAEQARRAEQRIVTPDISSIPLPTTASSQNYTNMQIR